VCLTHPIEEEALVAHRKAKLTVLGRLLLVQRIEVDGWPAATAASAQGVSKATAYKWLRRWRTEGLSGLADRSSRPHSSPTTTSDAVAGQVVAARLAGRWGPHRIGFDLGLAPSTVHAVLRLAGLSRLSTLDGPTALPVRYVRDRPGELIHIDVKKLGRIPDGGGHKVLGRAEGRRKKSKRVGTDYLHVAIDDATRLAFVAVHPNELGVTCAQFLDDAAAFFTAAGIPVIERVMTDNAKNYTISQAFQAALDGLGARHVRIRNYRPQTNGKAERFNRTMLNEWAYARPYLTNNERTEALPAWLEHYNNNRPHTGIGNHPPRHAVNNLTGNNS
jgi:transposase InsO family protein